MRTDVATAPRRTYLGSKPQRTTRAQVDAVEAAVDLHRFRQPARAARKVGKAMRATARPHDRQAFDRLECAQQHAGADAGPLARHVEAKVHAVDEVDIGVTAAHEQCAIPIRLADVGMAAGITGYVSLGFDDSTTRAALGGIAHERLADEKDARARRYRPAARRASTAGSPATPVKYFASPAGQRRMRKSLLPERSTPLIR